MLLTLFSFLLSGGIVAFGFLQGRRFFSRYHAGSERIAAFSGKLKTCAEGISFREVVRGWVGENEAIAQEIASDLYRVTRNEPTAVGNRRGWVLDIDYLCDGKRVFKGRSYYELLAAMPGLLTGLGILFTFVGLAFGVYGLDPSDAENLTSSVKQLLGGMSMAFLTSIAGIGTGLWWNWETRRTAMVFENAFRELRTVLREKPYLIVPEEMHDVFLAYQGRQVKALDDLEEAVFRAGMRAADQSGITALKPLLAQMTASSSDNVAQAMKGVADEIRDMSQRLSGMADLSGNLNQVLGSLAKERAQVAQQNGNLQSQHAGLLKDTAGVIADMGKFKADQERLVQNISHAAQVMSRSLEAVRKTGETAVRNQDAILKQTELLVEQWQTRKSELQQLTSMLEKQITGYDEKLAKTMQTVHGEVDRLLAESLNHFASGMDRFEHSLDALGVLLRGEEMKKKGLLGKIK